MAINSVQYVNADALIGSVGPSSEQQSADKASSDKLQDALKRLAKKGDDKAVAEGRKGPEAPQTSRSESLFKSLAEGKSGPTAKSALETFQKAVLPTSGFAKEVFGETTQKTPQQGFAAASSFARMSTAPGADKALAPVASEALIATTQTAGKGDKELKELEQAVGEFAKAFGHDDATPTVKKRMFKATTDAPGSERHKAGMEFGQSKSLKLMNGPTQEAFANKFLKADPKNPAALKETLKGLEKLAQDPKKLSPSLNSSDMKANFSNLAKAVGGNNKFSISMEAQEKILSSSKFHAMPMEARAKIQSAVGNAPEQAHSVAQAMGQIRDSRLSKFAAKISAKGTDKEALNAAVGECKAREIAFPPIEPWDGEGKGENGEPRDQKKYEMAMIAKLNASANSVKRYNEKLSKSLNSCTSLKQLNEQPPARTMAGLKGNFKTPEEFAAHHKCTLEVAKHVFKLDGEVEKHRTEDLGLSKKMATMRRSLRGKPERPTNRMEKRAAGAALPAKLTITLSEDASSSSTASLKKMLAGNASTKTAPSAKGGESVAAAPAASKEEIAARNTQTMRPKTAAIGTGGLKGWGNNSVQLGLDPNHKQKLVKMREEKSEQLKNDSTKLTKGPMIGRSSDFVPLSDIVANKMSWIALPPAMKAALRNLQVTPNILESWQTNKPIYSSLQAKPWDELKEIQRKSAQLVSLSQENWNALASALSTAIKRPAAPTDKKTVINNTAVKMKSGA